jgi:hypothetical protein
MSQMVITKGAAQDQKLIQTLTQNAQQTGGTVTLSGHSAGGRRNYVNLLNSDPNQYVDANGRPVLQAQFFGAPANVLNLKQATQNSGATYLGQQNNNGDFVGNGLGGNGSVLQAGWSGVNIISLFAPEVKLYQPLQKILNVETIKINSPHSNYYCSGAHCNYNNNIISNPRTNPSASQTATPSASQTATPSASQTATPSASRPPLQEIRNQFDIFLGGFSSEI